MAYLDVITLADAKNYLRVDDTLTEDDGRITSMIKACLGIVERRTNVLVYARSKSYDFQNGCVYVYDYPINTLITPTDAEVQKKGLYSIYTANVDNGTDLVLNVGYSDPAEVPAELVEIALNLLKYFYYEAETNKANYEELPIWLQIALDQQRRFII